MCNRRHTPSALVASWPDNFTRDIFPVALHSHNDYWRRKPFFDAISAGATGVETDVWLKRTKTGSNELLLGHTSSSLAKARTLRSLYIDPLIEFLEKQNPLSQFANASRNGVFDEDPSASMIVLIDFKMSCEKAWPPLLRQLEPPREKGWLTRYDKASQSLIQGPITVVVIGNAKFDFVTSTS
jgi:hypothetical protein